MKYSKIDGLDLAVSKLIFGCTIQSMVEGKDASNVLDSAFENGINTFDIARVYGLGNSELSFGKWLKTKKRDDIIIETKCCHPDDFGDRVNRISAEKDLDASLKALNCDYVDILLLHRDDEKVPVYEIMDFMNSFIKKGKVKAIGVSNWEKERIISANEYAKMNSLTPFTVSSPHFSLAEQVSPPWVGHNVSLTGKDRLEDRRFYAETKLPVFAYSSLAGGVMSGRYSSKNLENEVTDHFVRTGYVSEENAMRLFRAESMAKEKNLTVSQIALAYNFNQNMNIFSIISSSNCKRIEENCKSCEISLTSEELKWLNLEI